MARILSGIHPVAADCIIIGVSMYVGFSLNPHNIDTAVRACQKPEITTPEGYQTTTDWEAVRVGPFVFTSFRRVDERKKEDA